MERMEKLWEMEEKLNWFGKGEEEREVLGARDQGRD